MRTMEKKQLVFLTGAGISAESGLKTFRDSGGLWEGYNVYDVATPEAFEKNPKLVLDFYNARRKEVAKAEPNLAHKLIAELQEKYDVWVITQNIDDLHERAGSKQVLHLHGEIFKMHSVINKTKLYTCNGDINLGDVDDKGDQFRPHVVWFGEEVPAMEKAAHLCSIAEVFVVVGTSLQVYPAAGLVNYTPPYCPRFVIDKVIPSGATKFKAIEKTAVDGLPILVDLLNKME
jgi:NAD-dependent deacetylase